MNIVVLDGGTLNPGDLSWEEIETLGTVTLYNHSKQEEIVERSLDADILIVNKVVINATIINQLPQLQYIGVSATGYNNIDTTICAAKGILVSNIKNYGGPNVAQHVFALLLALTNRAQLHYQLIQQGEWLVKNAFSFWDAPLTELSGKTMGIIGWGNIGQKVARIAMAFEMNVVYYSQSINQSMEATWLPLEDLTKSSDVVSLHTHLTEANHKMVNASFLSQMKSSAYLINTARGDLIDEIALANALKAKQIAGAGLDVLSQEPPNRNHPLLQTENCLVTPHNAWASIEARQRLMNILVENIKSFIDGQPKNLIAL